MCPSPAQGPTSGGRVRGATALAKAKPQAGLGGKRSLEKGHCRGRGCVARKLARGAAQSLLRRRAEQMAATTVKCCRSVHVGIVVLSTYQQTSRCLLQKSASLRTERRKGRVTWTPSSRSHRASPSAHRGAPGRGCSVGHSSGKHHSGLSPRLTVATALVPAQQAGRQDLELPPNLGKVEAGRDLWAPSGRTPLLKQGCTEPAAQDSG